MTPAQLLERHDLARQSDPGLLVQHLVHVTETFQTCFVATRVTPRGTDPVTDLDRTPLWLAEAAHSVQANGANQLGLSAPEHP